MKKWKKSVWLPLVLLVYISATAAYLLPRNTAISTSEKWWTIGGGYLIVLVLWLVLRYKEKVHARYMNTRQNNDGKKEL